MTQEALITQFPVNVKFERQSDIAILAAIGNTCTADSVVSVWRALDRRRVMESLESLAKKGLLVHMGNGVYRLSELGRLWLRNQTIPPAR